MATDLAQGVELWGEIAEQLTDIIHEDGKILKDDQRIWRPYLHKYSNLDWRMMLEAAVELHDQHPEMFESYHIPKLINAVIVLTEHYDTPRILDTKRYKSIAWAMIMLLREVWVKARQGTKPAPTNFSGLFE